MKHRLRTAMRVTDRLWGYDFFLSYSHRDGELIADGKRRSRYVRELAARLRSRGFAVFLDEADYDLGVELNAATKRSVRASSRLLVVVRPRALNSPWVLQEVGEALRAGKDVIIIDVNGAFQSAPKAEPLRQALGETRLRFDELLDEEDGHPSPALVDKLDLAHRRSRRDRIRQRWVASVATLVGLLGLAATWQWAVSEARAAEIESTLGRLRTRSALETVLAGQPATARRTLGTVPESARGWPWRLVRELCGPEPRLVQVEGGGAEDALVREFLDGGASRVEQKERHEWYDLTVGEYRARWPAPRGQTGSAFAVLLNAESDQPVLHLATGASGDFYVVYPTQLQDRAFLRGSRGQDSVGNAWGYAAGRKEFYVLGVPRRTALAQDQRIYSEFLTDRIAAVRVEGEALPGVTSGLLALRPQKHLPEFLALGLDLTGAYADSAAQEHLVLDGLSTLHESTEGRLGGIYATESDLAAIEARDGHIQRRVLSANQVTQLWKQHPRVSLLACSRSRVVTAVEHCEEGELICFDPATMQATGLLGGDGEPIDGHWFDADLLRYSLSGDGRMFFIRARGRHHSLRMLWRRDAGGGALVASGGGAFITADSQSQALIAPVDRQEPGETM